MFVILIISLSAVPEPEPEAAPSSEEPSPPAADVEAVIPPETSEAPPETSEAPPGCLHTFLYPDMHAEHGPPV